MGGGGCGVSANEYSCAHGAQMNSLFNNLWCQRIEEGKLKRKGYFQLSSIMVLKRQPTEIDVRYRENTGKKYAVKHIGVSSGMDIFWIPAQFQAFWHEKDPRQQEGILTAAQIGHIYIFTSSFLENPNPDLTEQEKEEWGWGWGGAGDD